MIIKFTSRIISHHRIITAISIHIKSGKVAVCVINVGDVVSYRTFKPAIGNDLCAVYNVFVFYAINDLACSYTRFVVRERKCSTARGPSCKPSALCPYKGVRRAVGVLELVLYSPRKNLFGGSLNYTAL